MKAECHPDKNVYCKRLCRNCYEKQLRERNPEYAEKQKENSKNWHKNNKEKVAESNKQYRMTHKPDPENKYLSTIRNKLGITKEQYYELLSICNNKCQICGRLPYKGKRLHLDHCHKTGKVRGLLCARCNWYLHTIEKNPKVLDRIKDYLNYGNDSDDRSQRKQFMETKVC